MGRTNALLSEITLHSPLSLYEAIRLHSVSKKMSGTIYFIRNGTVVDCKKLPKLISFLMTTSETDQIKLIVDYEKEPKWLPIIRQILAHQPSQSFRKVPLHPMKKVKI
ncbi:hypothetical protein [Bacillus kexueae]|uniref:hypothetical protein n=1 Tax=Aeribacillus kexueae TaxID=2078952 RepID=UPI001FAEF277|nr:hypothetical protein [Bacillus kexueae]